MLEKLLKMMRKNKKGFTLVELMVVVAIIGILTAIAIPVYQNITGNAQTNSCKANLRTLASAIELYNAEEEVYPTTTQGLAILASGYVQVVPECPVDGNNDGNPDAYSYTGPVYTNGEITTAYILTCPNGHAL